MVKGTEFKTTFLDPHSPDIEDFSYDADVDTCYLKLSNYGGLHYADYCADGVYILVDEETQEMCGFMIEAWQKKFLKLHPDLRRAWYVMRVMSWLPDFVSRSRVPVRERQRIGTKVLSYAPC